MPKRREYPAIEIPISVLLSERVEEDDKCNGEKPNLKTSKNFREILNLDFSCKVFFHFIYII